MKWDDTSPIVDTYKMLAFYAIRTKSAKDILFSEKFLIISKYTEKYDFLGKAVSILRH